MHEKKSLHGQSILVMVKREGLRYLRGRPSLTKMGELVRYKDRRAVLRGKGGTGAS